MELAAGGTTRTSSMAMAMVKSSAEAKKHEEDLMDPPGRSIPEKEGAHCAIDFKAECSLPAPMAELLIPSMNGCFKSNLTLEQDVIIMERATTTTTSRNTSNAHVLVINDKASFDDAGDGEGGVPVLSMMNSPRLTLGQRSPEHTQSDVRHKWGCDLELASTKISEGGHENVFLKRDGPCMLDLNLDLTNPPLTDCSRQESHNFLDLERGASSSLSSLSSQPEESSFSIDGFTPDSSTCYNKPLFTEAVNRSVFENAYDKSLFYVVPKNNEKSRDMDTFTPETLATFYDKPLSKEPRNGPVFKEIYNRPLFYVDTGNNDESPKARMKTMITPSTSSEESIGNAGGSFLSRPTSLSPPPDMNCNHSCTTSGSMYSGARRNQIVGMFMREKSLFEEESSVSQSCGPCRPRVRGNGISERMTEITLHDLSQYFHMPITQASKELKVGLTVLKKRCREFGIPRWPHRKMKSLESLINNIQDLAKDQGVKSSTRVMTTVRELEEQKKLMEEMPGTELADRTKRLRQACFKANYKKRRLSTPSSLTSSLSSALRSLPSSFSALQSLPSLSSAPESVNKALISCENHASVVLDLNCGLIASANQIGFL